MEQTQSSPRRFHSPPIPELTSAEIITGKLAQFAQSRRGFAHALAQRHQVKVSDEVERFFDAVESGDWDKIDAAFKVINGGDSNATGYSASRPPGIEWMWPAIVDAYGRG